MDTISIPLSSIQQGLKEIEKNLPSANKTIWNYARFVSKYLPEQLTPDDFVLANCFAIIDLERGHDGDKKPITEHPDLTLQGGIIYDLLRINIPRIATALFPSDFANAVSEIMERVNNRIEGKVVD